MTRRAETPEKRARRMAIWRHCSLLGCAAMMRKHCQNVYGAATTTQQAKDLAMQINALATRLEEALVERVDP